MKHLLLTSCLALLACFSVTAQVTFEDFEGGTADIPWTGVNGTYNGTIANPDASGINTSGFVGSYTNSPAFDFNFAIADLPGGAVDLSENNVFKIKIWSPTAPSIALFKFEGGGQAQEKIVNITTANTWVEYTFDLSAGENKTLMTKVLISFNSFVLGDDKTYYWDDITAYKDEVYETYEVPSGITWVSFNGAIDNGPVANPGPDWVNSSATVGSFTNNAASDFSFFLGTAPENFNLAVFNQFKFKMWAPKPTRLLFKLEGAGGGVEKFVNIAVANAWQEYTVDFSGASTLVDINKILISYTPFAVSDADTYYIDDIRAEAEGVCVAATPDPIVIDDYDCNRNASYGVGWDSLTVIPNPFPSGDNNSQNVGRVADVTGAGSEYYPLIFDYNDPIDLSVRNQFTVQVYSTKAGTLLMKIEGGMGQKESGFAMVPNQWSTFTLDCADQVGKGHNKLVLFFNAGQNGEVGDVYYLDNVKLTEPTALPPVEDFEDGLSLFWQPLGGSGALHGLFSAPTPNPGANNVNDSDNSGCYTLGTSAFSTLEAFAATPFDLTQYPQFNLDVRSPAGGGTVLMILNSATGNKEFEATVTTPGEWETLSFDFSTASDVTDIQQVSLRFNSGTAAPGTTWCIDNLRQGQATVDPCVDVTINDKIVDDFECQRNFEAIFYGLNNLTVINNPYLNAGNPSAKVGKYVDPLNDPFAGIGYEFATAPDLSVYNILQVRVYSTVANLPFLFKFQGGTQVEIFENIPVANEWHTFEIDFSGVANNDNKQLVIFPNAGNNEAGTYWIDDVRLKRAGYNGCVSDYETPATSFNNFVYFNNGSYGTPFEAIPNPNPSGINTSSKVGKFVASADAGIYFGMFADLDAAIDFQGTKTIRMKTHMDHIGTVTVKAEIFGNPIPPVEVTIPNSLVNQWEELTFDFSAVADDAKYDRFTLFFDLATTGTGINVLSYFDDIVIGDGMCSTISTFTPPSVEAIKVSPNPATDRLLVTNLPESARLDVFNLYGQKVSSINTGGNDRSEVDVTRLPAGIYTLSAFNEQGMLIGNAKFVKQ